MAMSEEYEVYHTTMMVMCNWRRASIKSVLNIACAQKFN